MKKMALSLEQHNDKACGKYPSLRHDAICKLISAIKGSGGTHRNTCAECGPGGVSK